MSASYWRAQSLKAIEATVQRVGTKDLTALRHAIGRAYPFGVRNMYPYKIWLECVKATMATLEAKAKPVEAQLPASTATQPSLFGEVA